MRFPVPVKILLFPLALLSLAAVLSACTPTRPACSGPETRNLNAAVDAVKHSLTDGCEDHFDSYMNDLLTIAEGDPQPENKRVFSEFLLWASDEGLLSKRQAQNQYNRYFNVKFIAMMGDYNNCSYTCPRKSRVLSAMERELIDKERGLLRVSMDSQGYYRADELFKETELVLEATCTACAAGR